MASPARNDGIAFSLHASAVVIGEAGILIRGASGAGKSGLAFALVAAANQTTRFARLVGDDRIEIIGRSGQVIAHGHPAVAGMIELRGQGIARIAHEPAAVLRFIVDLVPAEETQRSPGADARSAELCGAKLPRLALPNSRSSYDCALLVIAALTLGETI